MQNFMKTIINAIQSWTKAKIKNSTADWNENDSSTDSYVKNRTHYEELKKVTLVDNLTSEDYSEGNNVPGCNFIPGQAYNVVWNGVLYEDLICGTYGEYNIIGDPSLLPFYIDDDGGNSLYIEADDSFVVSIDTVKTIVHKLDTKYLPDICVQSDWNENDDSAKSYIQNRPFYENLNIEENLFEKTTITIDSYGRGSVPNNGKYYGEGETYVVTFDGVPYECTSYKNSDECYILEFEVDGVNVALWDATTISTNASLAGEHTIKLDKGTCDFQQIDKKFLPIEMQSNITEMQSNITEMQSNITEMQSNITEMQDYLILKDATYGVLYKVQIIDGNLTSTLLASLDDFTYTTNDDGTYTITGWNKTYMGEPSTMMVVPDDSNIIL